MSDSEILVHELEQLETESKAKKSRKTKETVSSKDPSLLGALIKAQSEFPPIPKNHTNPFTKSKYADLSDIISAVRPVLNKNGLGLEQHIVSEENGELLVETVIYNDKGESRSSGLLSFSIGQGGNQFQTKGTALTYARRYTLCALLGIVADDDSDGELKQVKDTHIDPAVKAKAEKAAQSGMSAYQAFYKTMLTNDERAQLINSGVHDEIKKKLGA
ncbi:ERF family protein [Succinivibrio faecicola]|uniref:ERF family protein n=1 Tax=Succinivibrio faecicola TaxID=2820300 RepID=A0ABS7DIB7_9GAMM|nr:ERF family protein [Succinivibrio faecicola]MBW7571023.1 ERF family protein [Succinivibrio faecicola]